MYEKKHKIDTTVYHFAVHPLYNPVKLFELYQPLIDYLNSRLKSQKLVLEASRDYNSFEKKYLEKRPDFILPNPWQTIQAIASGYHVIAMAGEPEDFRGLIIVRKDKRINIPADLKGRSISYPSPTALAACIMPQYYLWQKGIDINKDLKNLYVGSQESSIMNVYYEKTDAGATWAPPWRTFQKDHPKEASELMVAWDTEPLVNNSVMARADIPEEVTKKIRNALIELDKTINGRKILSQMEMARFIAANDSDYEIVNAYLCKFEKEVRKVRTK